MYRFFILLIFACGYTKTANALSFSNGGCNFEDVRGEITILADIATAPIGSTVGEYYFKATHTCTRGAIVVLIAGEQTAGSTSSRCRTTVPGIELWGDTCRNPTLAGHAFFLVNGTGAVGNSQAGPYRFVKVGSVPAGPYTLRPTYNHIYSRDNYRRPETLIRHEPLSFDGGETPVNSCSLVSTDVKVDFGEVSDVGGSQPFSIEFGNCGGRDNVIDYLFSTALTYRSDRIRSDGSALRNSTCANCAKGIQIRLKNAFGQYIDLSKPNSLFDNGSAFTADGFKQSFTAELHRNLDEVLTPGAINTQLVFETVLE